MGLNDLLLLLIVRRILKQNVLLMGLLISEVLVANIAEDGRVGLEL